VFFSSVVRADGYLRLSLRGAFMVSGFTAAVLLSEAVLPV